MKAEFSGHPTFVWTDEGIKGHFAVCYVSQVVYSVLGSIDPSFRNTEIFGEGSYYKAIYTNSKALDALEKRFGYGLDAACLKENSLKKPL